MDNKPLENAIEKIYNEIAITGNITDNQLSLIVLYESKIREENEKKEINELFEIDDEIVKFLNSFKKE